MKKAILLILPALLLAGCSVKEKEMNITVFHTPVTSVYTGKVKRKLPEGEGRAMLDQNASVEGTFEGGVFISGTADHVPYTITYSEETINGTYTGEAADQLPNGMGAFDSPAFSYNGAWSGGSPDGPGTVSAEYFRIDTPDGILEGSYSGDVKKNLAEGNGTFLYRDGEDEIEMTGSFAGNQFDGKLIKTIRQENAERSYPVHYEKGVLSETPAAMIAYLEGMRSESYCLTDSQWAFISDHASLFDGKTPGKQFSADYDSTFQYASFSETSAPALILISGAKIRSVQRYTPYPGADIITSMIAENSDGFYHLFFPYSADNADQDDIVDIYALPLCRRTLTAPEQDYPAIDTAGAVIISHSSDAPVSQDISESVSG